MSERHPILDAPQEKQREMLEWIVGQMKVVADNPKVFDCVLHQWCSEVLQSLDAEADARPLVSREAYEVMWHWMEAWPSSTKRTWQRVSETVAHDASACVVAGGRCAFRPEDE